MPAISLAEVAANRRTLEVDLGLPPLEDGAAQTLTVSYRVNAVTPADELRFSTVKNAADVVPEEMMADFFAFFCRLVSSWQLTDTEGGESVPLTVDALKTIPTVIIRRVMEACMADLNDPKGSTSTAAN